MRRAATPAPGRAAPAVLARAPACAALAVLALALGCAARPAAAPELRVGTSGDYAPFSVDEGGALSGFDVAVARAFADDAGLALRFERFAWPALARDVAAARFTVAMSGVTVRPERSVVGRFSVPVARSGAVVLARRKRFGLAREVFRRSSLP